MSDAALAAALAEHLRDAPLAELAPEDRATLRGVGVGAPITTADGTLLPQWRLAMVDGQRAELTWTVDLGHVTGVRRWYTAHARRAGDDWIVTRVTVGHAHRRG